MRGERHEAYLNRKIEAQSHQDCAFLLILRALDGVDSRWRRFLTPSDAILMQRIVARDQEAFAILFARYLAQVTESLRWITRDQMTLTQEVFLLEPGPIRGKGLFGHCFARNLSLNQLRSHREMPSLYDEEDEEQPVPGWMIDCAGTRCAVGTR